METREQPVNESSTKSPRPEVKRQEVINSLNHWLWQCYHWQQVNFAITSAMMHTAAQTGVDVNRNVVPQLAIGIDRVKIPPISKRIAAEAIDCVILLVLKFIVTFIAIEYFEVIDLPIFDLQTIFDFAMIQPELQAFSMPEKWPIFVLESLHRFVVVAYETFFIWIFFGRGQTIGKYMMNIRVISCSQCEAVAPGILRVQMGRGVELPASFLRASMKNCGITFLFPVCATALFFQHNRAVYDQICGTLVIEEPRDGPRLVVN